MQPGDCNYDLPPELIAQAPLPERSASRLLHVVPDGGLDDLNIPDFANLLRSGDLLVVNDTRVLRARLFGQKATGGKVEMLLERPLGETSALAQLRASRAPGVGVELTFEGGATATVTGREGEFFVLKFRGPLQDILEAHGHVPLPPYIERSDDAADRERYQTVYARALGAVAAPTAGLHFDRGQLNRLRAKGVDMETLTLHVGAGTFAPLRDAQLESGRLHAERIEVSEQLCTAVSRTRERGGRVVAIGTTTMRALESAAAGHRVACSRFRARQRCSFGRDYRFRVVDALLTNFHSARARHY